MSANFYNTAGDMYGLDLHDYLGCVPPAWMVPIPGKALYVVKAGFEGPCADESTRLPKVTSSGERTIQGGFKREKVLPHLFVLPIPLLPPCVFEAAVVGMLVLFSGSTAQLSKATVTGGGKALATCIHGAFGANLNCADPFDLPLNLVHNENTVMTEPSASDFVEAATSAIVGGLISWIVGKKADKVLGDSWKKLLNPVRKVIEDKVKEKLNDWANEKRKQQVADTLSSLGFVHV